MLLKATSISARTRNGRPPKTEKGAEDLHTGPAEMELQGSGLEWLEAAEGDPAEGAGKARLKRFTMKAYTGGVMRVAGWPFPVVVNLAGLKIQAGPLPVLKNHNPDQIVGHSEKVEKSESLLTVEGIVSGTGEAAREVVETAANNFPWRVSVGAFLDDMVFVPEGAMVKANGKQFKGPLYVARKATLGELSFVPVGGDSRTSAKIAATAIVRNSNGDGDSEMNFEKWLEAKGFDPEKINDEQRKFLKAAFDAESAAEKALATPPADTGDGKGTPTKLEATGAPGEAGKTEEEIRAEAVKTERLRVTEIEAACKDFTGDEVVALRASAMLGDIDMLQLQGKLLGVLREGRPKSLAATGGGESCDEADPKILLAVAYRAGGIDEETIIKACGEPAIEAAYKLRGMGIQEFCARGAMLEGVELPRYQADPKQWLQAAFSTMSLPGILGNTTTRALLEGYNYVEDTWRKVVKIASVSDFKEHTRYRLTGDTIFKLVGKDGELKHATLSEMEFGQKADTKGIMFVLTRQDIINDDMGAFMALPQMIGMGAGEAIALAVWTLILSNPGSFFKTGNKNYATGAGTALDIDSLTQAEQMFLDQIKPNKRPLGVPPKKLLVPTALKVTAEQLMASLKLTEGGGSSKSKVPTDNPHAGKFEVACSAYLSNAAISGSSSLAWYLGADPNVLPAWEVAFLNGVDRPTVQSADADFDTLGIQFRGWVDFGVRQQDHRGMVKMKGEQ